MARQSRPAKAPLEQPEVLQVSARKTSQEDSLDLAAMAQRRDSTVNHMPLNPHMLKLMEPLLALLSFQRSLDRVLLLGTSC